MDWIRRNWPDLLIGMGLLAVIAGIVATLLTGGDVFPLGARDRQPPPPVSRAADPRPPVPGQGTLPTDTPTDTSPAGTPLGDGAPLAIPNLPSIAQPANNADAGAGVQPQDAPTVVALRPGDTASQPSVTASAPAAQNPLQPAAPAVAPAAVAAATPATAPATPATAPATITSPGAGMSPAEDPEAPYRVSVGSFLSAENAQRQAELFRQAGYPVFLASQGELSLVLLGPYRLETEAERVRTAVANGGFDVAPIIYTFRPDGASATVAPATQAPAAAAPQPQPPTAPAVSPAAAAPTASAAGRYLQAGAYSSQENAQLQRSTIEALGFRVTVQLEGNLLRVLVGPYGDNDLSAAQSSLARQGIDSIPR